MKIDIRLIGRLEEYWNTDEPLEIDEGATVNEALAALGIPEEDAGMIALNGSSVAKKTRNSQRLTEGDSITIMAPVHGG